MDWWHGLSPGDLLTHPSSAKLPPACSTSAHPCTILDSLFLQSVIALNKPYNLMGNCVVCPFLQVDVSDGVVGIVRAGIDCVRRREVGCAVVVNQFYSQ